MQAGSTQDTDKRGKNVLRKLNSDKDTRTGLKSHPAEARWLKNRGNLGKETRSRSQIKKLPECSEKQEPRHSGIRASTPCPEVSARTTQCLGNLCVSDSRAQLERASFSCEELGGGMMGEGVPWRGGKTGGPGCRDSKLTGQ